MSGVDAAEASLHKHVLVPGGVVPPQNKARGGTPELCNVFGALNLCNNTAVPGADDPFVCPLTHEVMVDPIVANDGYSYERTAFDAWLAEGKRTSPKTGLYLLVTSVLPNFALKRAIEMYYGRGREQASNGSTGSRGSGRGAVEQENEEEQGGSGRELDDSRGTPLSRTAVELAEDTLRESPCPQGQPSKWMWSRVLCYLIVYIHICACHERLSRNERKAAAEYCRGCVLLGHRDLADHGASV